MSKLFIAAFANQNDANKAIMALQESGYTPKDISVVTRQTEHMAGGTTSTAAETVGGATASGAATGGLIGGVAGLLAGAGVFPALAGLLIGGPIALALGLTGVAAATVSGVLTGAVAGGLIGALTGLGLPEEDAKFYDKTVTEGGYIVAVPATTQEGVDVHHILDSNGAGRVNEVDVPANTTPHTLG